MKVSASESKPVPKAKFPVEPGWKNGSAVANSNSRS